MRPTPPRGAWSQKAISMLLAALREQVLHANREIARRGLAPHTFGNASGIDRSGAQPLVVIKPSGVDYDALTAADLVVTDLDGKIVEGALRPSSDLDTHTLLYREFPQIGGIVHTHSEFATTWAQAGRAIPCLGTTHADYFHGPVPVTEPLTAEEVAEGYVHNTGAVIVRRFRAGSSIPLAVPGVLVAGHAPFAWGRPRLKRSRRRRAGVHCPAGLPQHVARRGRDRHPRPRLRASLFTETRAQSDLRPALRVELCPASAMQTFVPSAEVPQWHRPLTCL